MSMLLQQAFQQATPRWQRNWIVLPPSIIAGSTGLSGKGTSWSVVVLIDAHPEKRHRAPHWRGRPAITAQRLLRHHRCGRCLRRFRHFRWRRLEELRLVDQVDVLALEARPLLARLVVDRVDEAMPVLFVDEVLVGPIVEARIAGFLAELDVLHVRFGSDDPMVVLPG